MYSEIFLADFAVFRVFGGISRDFAEIPEFRGSATAWNIRSPDRIAVSILKALFTLQKKIGSGPIKKLVWTGYFCRVNLQYHVSMKWIQTRFFLYVSSTSLLYKWLALISLLQKQPNIGHSVISSSLSYHSHLDDEGGWKQIGKWWCLSRSVLVDCAEGADEGVTDDLLLIIIFFCFLTFKWQIFNINTFWTLFNFPLF